MRNRTIIAGLAALIATASVWAVTHFGGTLPGVVPPDKAAAKCEFKASKALGKVAANIIGCHAVAALGAVKSGAVDQAAEEQCETAAKAGFKIPAGCPTCLGTLQTILPLTETILDANNDRIWCEGPKALGGDDKGKIPPDKKTAKCEKNVAKAVIKLGTAIYNCHLKAATKLMKGKSFDNASCESAARARFHPSTTNCPCVVPTALADFVVSTIDGSNGLVFCASPSGAFVAPAD